MANDADRPRVLFGVAVTVQAVALLVTALGVALLVGYAVLHWLESTA